MNLIYSRRVIYMIFYLYPGYISAGSWVQECPGPMPSTHHRTQIQPQWGLVASEFNATAASSATIDRFDWYGCAIQHHGSEMS